MTPRAARLLRGSVLGLVATALAAVSHLAAGGPAPTTLALVLGAVFAVAVGTAAVGRAAAARPIGLARTVVAVVIAQLAFHLVFSLLGSGATVARGGGHHHEVLTLLADPQGAVAQGGASMWLAHLGAGALTVLYLRHLERRVWALLARVGAYLVRVPGIRMPAAARAVVTRIPATGRPALDPLRHAIARRGPPAPSRV
ncbi:hypothetical protein [Protaetiibacter intestinalis]|uniref:MFS transporter n=1 Tax=Protaetiibacter intestinalis TaxID=2419774 RepID=A0A387B0J4_9MICO|nr:hypothetical protein [Protaetiibacter intestinalis]AYF96992.1 hypothetical protein D7I47_01120 [Protaetiibacter intestinalis]